MAFYATRQVILPAPTCTQQGSVRVGLQFSAPLPYCPGVFTGGVAPPVKPLGMCQSTLGHQPCSVTTFQPQGSWPHPQKASQRVSPHQRLGSTASEASTAASTRASVASSCGSGSLTHFLAALPEPLFSEYDLMKVLGVGAYAVVYQVKNRKTQEDYALKVVEKEPYKLRQLLAQLRREVSIVEEHSGTPHIVPLREVTETASHFFLRFDLCKESLDDVSNRRGPMEEEEALRWLRQACLGIKELHASDIIHRDLKPSNFLVDSEGNLCICDFGFACRVSDDLSGFAGTFCYASPEASQEGDKHTKKVDIYCLGSSLQHFLLGRPPQGPEDIPKGLSTATRDLLEEMLSPDPEDRPTIEELLGETLFTQWLSQWQIILQGFSGE